MKSFATRCGHLLTVMAFLLLLGSGHAYAQEEKNRVPAGHSFHGETFNEGPRQKAYLMGGTGRVKFPVTTKSQQVQKFINQGIGQLHGFWYLEAERSFRQAAAIDPECAMAYWGAAVANLPQPWFTGDEKRAKGFIDQAVERRENVDRREAMYIDALFSYLLSDRTKNLVRIEKYAKALEDIALAYPDDIEAKALTALQLYKLVELRRTQNPAAGIAGHLAADALLQQVFAVEPLHPAHHFRIHLWDFRKPEHALDSAAVCGQSAPHIAHMWHMPGHIYSRLHRYTDACWNQEASARVDHAQMMRDRLMPDQIHNYAHNNEWLVRNLLNIGRVHDAIDLAKNMIELPQHPKYNTLNQLGSASYGRQHLLTALSKYEMWDELIALCDSPYLPPSDNLLAQAQRLRFLGEAYYRQGNAKMGGAQLKSLATLFVHIRQEQQKAFDEAGKKAAEAGKDEKEIEADKRKAMGKFARAINMADSSLDVLRGYQAITDDDLQEAVLRLEVGGADRTYLARVILLSGDEEEAIQTIHTEVESRPNQVQPLTVLIDILWQVGKKTEAAEAFEKLRKISGSLDMNTPIVARLAPIAEQLKLPKDWRNKKIPAADIGRRPELSSLGPFRWSTSPAPPWTLADALGNKHSLAQYRGKPVIVIFYLGYECLHCAEQLEAFAPATKEFAKAGITLIAVSTDGQAGLKKSLENYKPGKFPFPLVADAKLDIFKAYRCYDDFEKQPLHGTFVIDAAGKVLWQDISYQPFMDYRFVLQEAKRLLAQQASKTKSKD